MNIKKFVTITTIASIGLGMSFAKSYKGAELYSNEIFHYGKFEARMQMAAGNGLVSSMFLYHNDSYMGNGEPWVEVDIEILGKSPNTFQSNIISGSAENQVTSEQHHSLTPDADQGYHTYCLEWTPDYISWKIDDKEVRRTKKGENKNQVEAMVKDQGLRFNLWSSEDSGWVGEWNDGILPKHQFINWVKVYDYTPGQGENGTDFKLKWTDDFDSFDGSRWSKGDWTFDKNRVDMSPSNINVKDGTLILSITKEGNEGFNGTVPTDPAGNASTNPTQPTSPTTDTTVTNPPPVTPKTDTTVTNPPPVTPKTDTTVTNPQTPPTSPDEPSTSIVARASAASVSARIHQETLQLEVPSAAEIRWEIADVNGKILMHEQKNYAQGSHSISLERLPAGLYFMNLRAGSQNRVTKFIKK